MACWIVEVVNKEYARRWVKSEGGRVLDARFGMSPRCYETRAVAQGVATRLRNRDIFRTLFGHSAEVYVRQYRRRRRD